MKVGGVWRTAALLLCVLILQQPMYAAEVQTNVTTHLATAESHEEVPFVSTMAEMMLGGAQEIACSEAVYSTAEIDLLACIVRAEAGNQGMQGKQLVVDVVLNRVESERFPNTIYEVIYQRNQFSTVTDGALARAEQTVDQSDYDAVYSQLQGTRVDQQVLFFTAGCYNPYCVPLYKCGDHYFGR